MRDFAHVRTHSISLSTNAIEITYSAIARRTQHPFCTDQTGRRARFHIASVLILRESFHAASLRKFERSCGGETVGINQGAMITIAPFRFTLYSVHAGKP